MITSGVLLLYDQHDIRSFYILQMSAISEAFCGLVLWRWYLQCVVSGQGPGTDAIESLAKTGQIKAITFSWQLM